MSSFFDFLLLYFAPTSMSTSNLLLFDIEVNRSKSGCLILSDIAWFIIKHNKRDYQMESSDNLAIRCYNCCVLYCVIFVSKIHVLRCLFCRTAWAFISCDYGFIASGLINYPYIFPFFVMYSFDKFIIFHGRWTIIVQTNILSLSSRE